MLKLVFDTRAYSIRDYTLTMKQPSTKQVVESFGGFSSVFSLFGNSKETKSIKCVFRKKEVYNQFKEDLFSPNIKVFSIYELNYQTKEFDLVGQFCFTGDFNETTISDPFRKFKKEISFSCVRVV